MVAAGVWHGRRWPLTHDRCLAAALFKMAIQQLDQRLQPVKHCGVRCFSVDVAWVGFRCSADPAT